MSSTTLAQKHDSRQEHLWLHVSGRLRCGGHVDDTARQRLVRGRVRGWVPGEGGHWWQLAEQDVIDWSNGTDEVPACDVCGSRGRYGGRASMTPVRV